MCAYPIALRQRVVAAYLGGEGSFAEIAERFMVSAGFVHAMVGLFERTGRVHPKPHAGGRAKLGARGESALAALVNDQPDLTLSELRTELIPQGRLAENLSDSAKDAVASRKVQDVFVNSRVRQDGAWFSDRFTPATTPSGKALV
jgi:hypothetical protein